MTEQEAPNAELFVSVLAHIEREPDSWLQCDFGSYDDCGTPRCFAGWAVTLSGRFAEVQHSIAGIPLVAEDALGIGSDNLNNWPNALFHPCNELDDLYRISADILGVEPEILRDKVAAEVADGATQ